ncbi:MAG: acylphosphatase [Leptolyngbyaceae cyanobacterium SM1_1_3]|nr:acylphosphatase [Leptolyngbyaceae cyanobacterium SM1_1_3]NJN01626.1 acylphosphatase [Leptolyngbyaceae cyanobacterium RM1_1_2]NJO09869.1 acylphosphatase [Leptolyngbyaceae cyanobacterium SL_1_1]
MERIQLIVHGVVQAVGFRYHTCQEALQLGVTGYVKNLPDGTVEIVAEGSPDALRALSGWAKQGPPAAQVRHIEIAKAEATGEFNSFAIAY